MCISRPLRASGWSPLFSGPTPCCLQICPSRPMRLQPWTGKSASIWDRSDAVSGTSVWSYEVWNIRFPVRSTTYAEGARSAIQAFSTPSTPPPVGFHSYLTSQLTLSSTLYPMMNPPSDSKRPVREWGRRDTYVALHDRGNKRHRNVSITSDNMLLDWQIKIILGSLSSRVNTTSILATDKHRKGADRSRSRKEYE